MADISSNTVDGLIAFCDYLMDKGYAPTSQVEPWKTAIKKVFYIVNGEDYGPSTLDGLDVDDLIDRFRVLANDQYKYESITAYGRRVQNALDAHAYFRENNRPPAFRQVTKRSNGDASAPARKAKPTAVPEPSAVTTQSTNDAGGPEFFDFSYPLESGHMATLRVPKRMSKADVDRLTTVLGTLRDDGEDSIAA